MGAGASRRVAPARWTAVAGSPAMILAGDIGGTSTRLALFDVEGGRVAPVAGATFPSASLTGLGEALDQFINPRQRTLVAAGFGIAGPVIGHRAKLPNLPWSVE